MSQMYKVFFNDSLLLFAAPDQVPAGTCVERVVNLDRKTLGRTILDFELSGVSNYCLTHSDPDQLFALFSSFYMNLEAAGGLVRHVSGRYLFIKRFGKWDLPKGKIEEGELPEQAAIREVTEECGIDKPEIEGFIQPTYHTYTLEGTRILKKTWWFRMKYEGSLLTVPQKEEGITEAVWLVPSRFDLVLGNTYRSLSVFLSDVPWNLEDTRITQH